jgi:hypothetical protein
MTDLIKLKRRLGIAVTVAIFNQVAGQSCMSQYGAIFIKCLKIMNTFTFTALSSAITCIGAIITFSVVDTIGRRIFYLVEGTASHLRRPGNGGRLHNGQNRHCGRLYDVRMLLRFDEMICTVRDRGCYAGRWNVDDEDNITEAKGVSR